MDPRVTIITTTHNIIDKEQTDDFNLMVNLLDMQTYPEIEHLIIDNASTDGTDILLKDYKNKGYLNFFSERDTSKFHGYNKGIMRAKGKYIAFISVDDFFHDITAIQDVVNLMEANNADFSFSPAYCRHPDGFVFLFQPAMHNAFQVMPCARQAMFFKKSVLEKENYFDEKFKILSEFDLIIRLMLKNIKVFILTVIILHISLVKNLIRNRKRQKLNVKRFFIKIIEVLCAWMKIFLIIWSRILIFLRNYWKNSAPVFLKKIKICSWNAVNKCTSSGLMRRNSNVKTCLVFAK